MKEYDGVHEAFIGSLNDVMNEGTEITVRGMPTLELRGQAFMVKYAKRRMLAIPERSTNPFAQIAETLWMLSGSGHLDWLELYIPQCKKWSDDGNTWRGAYGPRLRKWMKHEGFNLVHVDQLYQVQHLLKRDPETRQAVMSIWDPAQDWVKSKDIPCNNWLQFIIRDGHLHMHVAVRSNDAVYGFSHNDFFSWSVLLQMMAFWVGVKVGSITWFAGSYHVYDKNYKMATQVSISKMPTMYKYIAETKHSPIQTPDFDTEFKFFDDDLKLVLDVEKQVRTHCWGGEIGTAMNLIEYTMRAELDKFMGTCLGLMGAYVMYRKGYVDEAVKVINSLEDSDMKVASIFYMIRNGISFDEFADCFTRTAVKEFVESHHNKFI